MSAFIPGLELSHLFFSEAVQPILQTQFPALRYDAGLIGAGSEVLGFDTERSTDHHWGCRVILFFSDADQAQFAPLIDSALRQNLPYRFRDYPTSMKVAPGEPHVRLFDPDKTEGDVEHLITITTIRDFMRGALAWEIDTPLEPADWLTFPQQRLRTLTAGGVWHTGLGELDSVRARLAYFPDDVWLYMLAAGWARIGQEEPFVGRCGDVGDDLGSQVIAARLARDVMMLCFLMERVYAPYPKWFGTGFARLRAAETLTPILSAVIKAADWHERETALSQAYRVIAHMHNALNLTDPLPTEVSPFHGRPYRVIHGDQFADTLIARITDPAVKRIAARTLIGSIDQFSDSTDFRDNMSNRATIKALYD